MVFFLRRTAYDRLNRFLKFLMVFHVMKRPRMFLESVGVLRSYKVKRERSHRFRNIRDFLVG